MDVSFKTLTCQNALAMPKKVIQSKDDVLGVAVTLDRKETIRKIAAAQERSLSYIGGKLLERGLAAYLRDGLLNEQAQADQPQKQSGHLSEQGMINLEGRLFEANLKVPGATYDEPPNTRAVEPNPPSDNEVEDELRDRPSRPAQVRKRKTS